MALVWSSNQQQQQQHWELPRNINSWASHKPPESETQGTEPRNQHASSLGDSDAPWSCRATVLTLPEYIQLNKVHPTERVATLIYPHILLIFFGMFSINLKINIHTNRAINNFTNQVLLILWFQQNKAELKISEDR